MLIYKVTNLINNKVYIGLTIQTLNARKSRHLIDAKIQRYNSYFHAAIRKHGKDNFQWEIIKTAQNEEQLKQFEIEEISKYQSNNPEFGYNLTIGGDALFGKDNPFYGKTHSEETRQKLREINLGKCSGDKNYFYDKHFDGELNPFYGKRHKESSKKLIGEVNSRYFKITTKDGNSIIIKNLHTFCKENNLVYHSVKLASRYHKWFKKTYLIESCDSFGVVLEDKNLQDRLKKYQEWHANYRKIHKKI